MLVAGAGRVSMSAAVKESSSAVPERSFTAVVTVSVIGAMPATKSPVLEAMLATVAARFSVVVITGWVTVATEEITGSGDCAQRRKSPAG